MTTVGDVLELAYGKALKAEDRAGGTVPVVGSGGIVGLHSVAITEDRTIVVGRKGSIGSVTWIDGPAWPIDTAYYVKAKEPDLDLRWTYWLLNSLPLASMNKSAAVPGLNRDDVYRLPVSVPSTAEQRRIAAILDRADAIRSKRRQALAHLEEILPARFARTVANSQFSTRPLADMAEIWDCPHSTPRWTTSGQVCLRTSNLTAGGWNWSDTRFVDEAQYTSRSKGGGAQPGDIVLSREGTVGIAAIVQPGMRVCMGQRLVQVRSRAEMFLPEWALACLLTALHPSRIAHSMVGSTAQHLNVKDLRALHVPVPDLGVQQTFADLSAQVERARSRVVHQVATDDALFASLQARAFRGEL